MNQATFYKHAKKLINSKIITGYKPEWMNYIALKTDGKMYVTESYRCYALNVNPSGVSEEIVIDMNGKVVSEIDYPDSVKRFSQSGVCEAFTRFYVDKTMLTVIKNMIQIASLDSNAKKSSKRDTVFKVEKKKYSTSMTISTYDSYFDAEYKTPCTNEMQEFSFHINAHFLYELLEMLEGGWADLDFYGRKKPIEFTGEHDVLKAWICPYTV